ncbi:pyridoxamine 5'-phosphate oxidase family protein [Mycoplasmatota bacterium]|nr:pyridoxamine 5'-phosphate oxidase family protein [Mycoplasmatota bacterium]
MFKKMRRMDKALSKKETLELLDKAGVGILGTMSDNGYPYTIALNYVYYQNKVYFHCAKEGHKINNIKAYEKVSFTVCEDVEIVGQELNTKYKSLILFGKAKVIKPSHEILWELIKKYSTIDFEQANKMIDKEINDTAIVEITIDHITGKRGR